MQVPRPQPVRSGRGPRNVYYPLVQGCCRRHPRPKSSGPRESLSEAVPRGVGWLAHAGPCRDESPGSGVKSATTKSPGWPQQWHQCWQVTPLPECCPISWRLCVQGPCRGSSMAPPHPGPDGVTLPGWWSSRFSPLLWRPCCHPPHPPCSLSPGTRRVSSQASLERLSPGLLAHVRVAADPRCQECPPAVILRARLSPGVGGQRRAVESSYPGEVSALGSGWTAGSQDEAGLEGGLERRPSACAAAWPGQSWP